MHIIEVFAFFPAMHDFLTLAKTEARTEIQDLAPHAGFRWYMGEFYQFRVIHLHRGLLVRKRHYPVQGE